MSKKERNFNISIKDSQTILDEIDFKTIEDKLVCESIIDNLEKQAADALIDLKTVNLPLIGSIRVNPVKHKIRNSYDEFKIARKNLNKEEYKEHIAACINDIKNKQKIADSNKLLFKRIRRNNKDRYERYCTQFGKEYAEMYIYAIYLFTDVIFDKEWEEQYKQLSDDDS